MGGENLTFNGAYCNAGSGLDVESGVFTCPIGGTYMFQFHLATHDNKKALLSIIVNDKEIASVFDQNHKDNHKNSMAGTNVVHNVKRGDKVSLYAYTGTWLADFPANHYTHFVGLLLQPNQEEMDLMMKRLRRRSLPNLLVNCLRSNSDQNLNVLIRPLPRLPGYCRHVRAESSRNV